MGLRIIAGTALTVHLLFGGLYLQTVAAEPLPVAPGEAPVIVMSPMTPMSPLHCERCMRVTEHHDMPMAGSCADHFFADEQTDTAASVTQTYGLRAAPSFLAYAEPQPTTDGGIDRMLPYDAQTKSVIVRQ